MENDKGNRFESVYSSKMRAGKRRTYFFDVRKTKGEDYYVTLTESTRRSSGEGYDRHKIFLYKEDFNRFVEHLSDAVNHVKTDLMPDYNYDEFSDRYDNPEDGAKTFQPKKDESDTPKPEAPSTDIEEDISW